MSTDQLRDLLRDAFGTVALAPAPIDRAIRQGKVVRLRRRIIAVAGVAAVVAAGISIPLAPHWGASPAPPPGPTP